MRRPALGEYTRADRATETPTQIEAESAFANDAKEDYNTSTDRPLVRKWLSTTFKPRKMDADSPRMQANYVKTPSAQANSDRDEYLARKHKSHVRAGRGHPTMNVESDSSLFINENKRAGQEAKVVNGLIADLENVETEETPMTQRAKDKAR